MSTATELLRRALEVLEGMNEDGWLLHGPEGMDECQQAVYDSIKDIRAFLVAEPESKPLNAAILPNGARATNVYEAYEEGLKEGQAEPEAEPVAWTNQHELNALGTDVTCYMYSEPSFGEMYTENDIPLYLHPPRPAEVEAEPVAYINLDEKRLEWVVPFEFKSSCFVLGKLPLYLHPPKPAEVEAEPFADSIPKGVLKWNPEAEPVRKPMTEEEMRKGSGEWAHLHNIFEEGIRYAEKHHGIGGDDT